MKAERNILSFVFLLCGGITLAVLAGTFMGWDSPAGSFLWKSYSYASFGMPLLFFWIFAILIMGDTCVHKLISPVLFVVPIFSFGIGFRIMLWQPPEIFPPFWYMADLFGKTTVIVIWFFAGSAMTVCIAILHVLLTSLQQSGEPANTNKNGVLQRSTKKMTDSYNRLKQVLSGTQTDPPQMYDAVYAQSLKPEVSYDSANVYTHAKNHTGYKYIPETSMTKAEKDRYLLIFNREELKERASRALHKEFEREAVQDAVPLGAEGYVREVQYASLHADSHENLHRSDDSKYGTASAGADDRTATYADASLSASEYTGASNGSAAFDCIVDDIEDAAGTVNKVDSFKYGREFSAINLETSQDIEEQKTKLLLNPSYSSIEPYDSYDGSAHLHEVTFQGDIDDETIQFGNDLERGMDAIINGAAAFVKNTGNAELLNKKTDADELLSYVNKPDPKRHPGKRKYSIPIHGVLSAPSKEGRADVESIQRTAEKLEKTLQEFSIDAKVVSYCCGPVVTMFEILPAPGVRLNRIVTLSDNIALRLSASSIRIIAPIPGKEAVGIEVPNENRDTVALSELISHKKFHNKEITLPLVLGKDVEANACIADLSRMPHLLIAGATGSGKSVCVNTILCSLLFRCSPSELKFLLVDPKTVELNFYNGIAHLLTPVIDSPDKAVQALRWCVDEMERRYRKLSAQGVREIRSYNAKPAVQKCAAAHMPYILIVIDEFADLMLTCGKEIETLVSRIAAKSRAVGMHLILATQRPSTDVITGIIKANIPSRIAFMVASKTDSRIILDQNGADKLLGRGDMLFSSASDLSPVRIQGAYLSEDEVARVVEQVKQIGGEPDYLDEDELFPRTEEGGEIYESLEDPLWDEAVGEVRDSNKASASYLQRRFRIGYNRAARLIDAMEDQGIIGPQQGSRPRSVFAE